MDARGCVWWVVGTSLVPASAGCGCNNAAPSKLFSKLGSSYTAKYLVNIQPTANEGIGANCCSSAAQMLCTVFAGIALLHLL